MLGKQIAALSLSGLLLFSGAVTAANADEATPIDTTGYAAAAEVLAGNGVASSAATAMQTGSGLRLAQASGLLDGGETPTLNQLAAQALLQETAALEKQNFLAEYDGVLVDCGSYLSLRAEPDTSADRLRIIFDGKAAQLLDVTDDGEVFTVVTGPSDMLTVRKALQEAGFDYDSADQVMQPKNEVELSLDDARKVSKLIDNLDDLDDVQNIYSNWTASDEVMAQLDEE